MAGNMYSYTLILVVDLYGFASLVVDLYGFASLVLCC